MIKAFLAQKLLDLHDKITDQPKDRKEYILRIVMNAILKWKIPGDYLEFGVYQGNSFITAYKQAQQKQLNSMRFYAFDSFAGLPEVNQAEAKVFNQGDYSCSFEQFRENLIKNGIDLSKVDMIKGFYHESLSDTKVKENLKIEKAAVVLVDCDLYESTREVLRFITPYLQSGTILLFDDWFSFGGENRGEMLATEEWLQDNPQIRLLNYYQFGVSGVTFVVQLREKPI